MNNYIFLISKDITKPNDYNETLNHSDITNINNNLRNELQFLKNSIHNNKIWDLAKRSINEYECIFSSSKKYQKICKKKSISRAYFKLWEILKDFNDELFNTHNKKINTAHIAEGPGGFIECIVDYKNKYNININCIYGITLLIQSSTENKIPFWKLSKEFCQENKIYINRKIDNIGDLYNIENIENFIEKTGKNNCDIVTADGGFDFSLDFNNQEKSFLRLFLSEIYTASQLQKVGGSFIIKVFDTFSIETNILISILAELYKNIYIIKPFTSRPANSEKYLVCLNYQYNNSNLLNDCKNEICNNNGIYNSLFKYYNEYIATRLTVYNTYYSNRQIVYLNQTLNEAQFIKDNKKESEKDFSVEKNCIEWCKLYDIEY